MCRKKVVFQFRPAWKVISSHLDNMILTSLYLSVPLIPIPKTKTAKLFNRSQLLIWHPLQALIQKANQALEPQLRLLVQVLLDAEKVGAVLPVLETRTFTGVRDWILNGW